MIILRKKPDNMQINVLNRLHYSNINKEHKYRKEEWVPLEICVPRVLDMKMMKSSCDPSSGNYLGEFTITSWGWH